MRKDKRDVVGTNFIKSDTGEIKVEGAEVCERWKEYFEALLNGESELEMVEGPLHKITEQEVENALKGMKSGRVAGPSGLMRDMQKCQICNIYFEKSGSFNGLLANLLQECLN